MSLPSQSKQSKIKGVGNNLRQLVINETGVEDPSPTFLQDYLAGLQERNHVKDLDDAAHLPGTDPAESLYSALNNKPTGLGLDLDLDTAAAQYPTRDYTIESLAGLDPNDPLAKQIVQALMDIEDASPAMIQDIMRDAGLPIGRSGAPSPEPSDYKIYAQDYTYICQCEVDNNPISSCPHTEGEVTVLAHEHGVNDLGAGGLQRHAANRSSLSPIIVVPISPQDRIACKADWESLAEFQPNGLVSLQMLKDGEVFAEALLDQLPSSFHTTVTGLKRAVDEITGRVDEEVVVLNALFVRGGQPGNSNPDAVIYAEELVPYVNEGEDGYDEEFWESIELMRRENYRSGVADLLAWAAV